jgi:hypothetical protein
MPDSMLAFLGQEIDSRSFATGRAHGGSRRSHHFSKSSKNGEKTCQERLDFRNV